MYMYFQACLISFIFFTFSINRFVFELLFLLKRKRSTGPNSHDIHFKLVDIPTKAVTGTIDFFLFSTCSKYANTEALKLFTTII